MFKPDEYVQLYKSESAGTYGAFGIEIRIASSQPLPDLQSSEVWCAAANAAKLIEGTIRPMQVAADPTAMKRASDEREALIGVFDDVVYVEDLPNGYCSDWCCKHLPWFRVTTPIGHFVIGARKRVIQLDWSGTRCTITADTLFPNENVTKGEYSIHAWSVEDLRRYISKIMDLIRSLGTSTTATASLQQS